MWEAIIKALIETFQKRTAPRRKLVQVTRHLYSCMNACHREYVALRRSQGSDSWGNEGEAWRQEIIKLIAALWEMQDVLDIFAPEVATALKGYVAREVESYYRPSSVDILALPPAELDKYELLVSSVWHDAEMSTEFDNALQALRKFMRDTFTQEELL